MADPNTQAMVTAAFIQAGSAVATVLVTGVLALITWRYARESKRMADAVVREFELRVAPVLEFEERQPKQVMTWDFAKVPMTVRNLGSYAAVITAATLEFWTADGAVFKEPLRDAEGSVEPQSPRRFDLTIPLSKITDRPGRGAGGHVRYRISCTVRGVTGGEVAACSQEFSL